MSDQIQRTDGEWQMLLNNAHSMVESLTNRVEARDAQVESLQRENEELRNREQALGEALRFHGFTFEFAEDGSLKCGSENAAMEELARRAITPEMREELSAALTWIEKQIDSGSDVTISRLHEHSTFGPAVVVSVRRGYSSPVKIYGETLVGAISTAANSGLLGEKEYLSGDSIEKQKYLPSDLLGEQG